MRNIFLSRIYLENFKLFDHQTLNFVKGLNVFDGPNGYGKTSVFDAIELVITGTIKRIVNNSAINGTLSYQHNFLANDTNKDVIIKVEFFIDEPDFEKRTIVIAKKIPGNTSTGSSSERNPKKLPDIILTYILPSFDIVELHEEYLVPRGLLQQKQIDLFGVTSQNLFLMLYYIQQEDRLDFFKNSEKDRVRNIDVLFRIEQEKAKYNALESAKKRLRSLIGQIKTQKDELDKKLVGWSISQTTNEIAYIRLFNRDVSWDKPKPLFPTESAMEDAVTCVLGIKALISNLDSYKKDLQNQKCRKFLSLSELDQKRRLSAYLLYFVIGDNLAKYLENKADYEFLTSQLELSDKNKYYEINYKGLSQHLQLKNNIDYLQMLVDSYNQNQKTSSISQRTLANIFEVRQQLIKLSFEFSGKQKTSTCQLCGYNWNDPHVLEERINSTTKDLTAFADDASKQCINISTKLKETFLLDYKSALTAKLNSYTSDSLFMEFYGLHNADYQQIAVDTKHFMASLQLDKTHLLEGIIQDIYEQIPGLQQKIRSAISILSPHYEEEKEKYRFDSIVDSYFSSLNDIESLKMESLDIKIEYLRYSYQITKQGIYHEYISLQNTLDKLQNEIAPSLDEYIKRWKQSISRYQSQIVSKIEIPFYIYSSRILQSYQGGQGILLRQNNSIVGEVDSIRFTSPSQEHDVLYTMSSGQLSGVLLSFSLALNKTFADDGLKTVFIDDPVQCMDDLNIVSFVELLRNDFKQSQLLISTHEKGFANYITYKYKKNNLEWQHINLKDQ